MSVTTERPDATDDQGPSRLPIAIVIAVVLVGMIVLGSSRAPETSGTSRAAPASFASSRPASDTRSSVWVCPGGPLGDDAERTLVIANLGSRDVPVETTALVTAAADAAGTVAISAGDGGGRVLTITPDGERPQPRRYEASARARIAVIDGQAVAVGDRLFDDERRTDLTLAARSVERVPVRSLTRADAPALLVQPFGPDVVVEHEVVAADDVSLSPCATQAGDTWIFAAGTTAKGAEQYLALVNPFPVDAVVDVDFVVAKGRKTIDALEVPRRAQVLVRVDQIEGVLRERAVATIVRVRTGRVVAEQAMRLDGVRGGTGVELSLGAPAAGTDWSFPAGDGERDASRVLTVVNPGELDATIEVTAAARSAVEPQQFDLPAGTVTSIDVGELVPDAARYLLAVQGDNADGVVAGDVDVWRLGVNATGIAGAQGITTPARRWTFAGASTGDAARTELVASTSSAASVGVSLRFVSGGEVRDGGRQLVAPGLPAVLKLPKGLSPETAIEITADGPIAVERVITDATGYTRSAGIPGP